MTELLTAAQMRAIEEAAIASGAVTGLELMERAGRGVVEAIMEWRPELAHAPHRAVVLSGPGNNGGDGFVVARLLRQRGWEVEVWLFGDEAKLKGDAAENARRWREMGEIGAYDPRRRLPGNPDIWVDAIFGTGLTRPLPNEVTRFFQAIFYERNWRHDPVIAVDILSGLCSDSGRRLTKFPVAADLTVSFHGAKLGHFLAEGPETSGRLAVADIGLVEEPAERLKTLDERATLVGNDIDHDLLQKKAEDHKYHHGHALILAGGPGEGGAARLAARGALRVGAGLVTVCAPPEAVPENAAQLNAVMLRAVADGAALAGMLEDERLNALALGPGLGVGERTRGLVTAALEAKRGTVLDADALTSFADDPEVLFALLHQNCVLTPHTGEFARLFPDIAGKLSAPATKGPAYSKVDAARAAAARAGCTVLVKGPDTVIANRQGRVAINSAHYERAAPWLATAGAGDVLAGMITGLLARGFSPMGAAETAAWLHVEAARKFGPGLIAEDLPETIPAVFRDLGL